ncbi:unnamed protein product, partial [Coregonus sp. 'balchen']
HFRPNTHRDRGVWRLTYRVQFWSINFFVEFPQFKFAAMFGVSKRTIRRRMQQYSLRFLKNMGSIGTDLTAFIEALCQSPRFSWPTYLTQNIAHRPSAKQHISAFINHQNITLHVQDSQSTGLMMWTSIGLVVMVTVLGLVLLLFYRQRRGTRRTPPPPPVSSNTQPDPTGEVRDTRVLTVCMRRSERQTDRQTDTLPVVIPSVYSAVNSPTNSTTYPAGKDSTTYPAGQDSTNHPAGQASTTYPAGQASTTYPAGQVSTTYPAGQASTTYSAGRATGSPHCDIYANASCRKYYINPSYSTADHPASLIYSNVDLPKDSRVSLSPPTASGTQDDSIYSTAQLPKD